MKRDRYISGRGSPQYVESYGFPMVRIDLNYCFIEERPYIQGIVLFDGMYRALTYSCPYLEFGGGLIKVVKFIHEITTLSWVEAFEKRFFISHPLKDRVVASAELEAKEGKYIAIVVGKRDSPVRARISKDYNGQHVVQMSFTENGIVNCVAERIYSFLDITRAVGEAHRDIAREYDGIPVRWAFFEGLRIIPECPVRNTMRFNLSRGWTMEASGGVFDYRYAKIEELDMEYGLNSCMYIPKPKSFKT